MTAFILPSPAANLHQISVQKKPLLIWQSGAFWLNVTENIWENMQSVYIFSKNLKVFMFLGGLISS